jgi:hypothetical protein
MHDHDDRWAEFHKRREEWRARWRADREARRQAWRERRAARRAGCGQSWGSWGGWGMDPADWGMGGQDSAETAELKAQVDAMNKTIADLGERIVVLEKLAVSSDDARLAAEIEKLRGKDE